MLLALKLSSFKSFSDCEHELHQVSGEESVIHRLTSVENLAIISQCIFYGKLVPNDLLLDGLYKMGSVVQCLQHNGLNKIKRLYYYISET